MPWKGIDQSTRNNPIMYDEISSLYHLVYADWDASVRRQASQLSDVIRSEWGEGLKSILDVTCGIGTQAIGLAALGFSVTASDISRQAVTRAELEATRRKLQIGVSVCDIRAAHAHHGSGFELVISCDNSIPHLLSDDEIRLALEQMHQCAKSGGGCLVTLRDYDVEARGKGLLKPYGVREWLGRRYVVFQIWDFTDANQYDLSMYFIEDADEPKAHVGRSRYYAVSPNRVMELMCDVGFNSVRRLDDVFYQPVLVGTKA